MDPHNPILVGGLGQNEEKLGVMKMRFKRHRWACGAWMDACTHVPEAERCVLGGEED